VVPGIDCFSQEAQWDPDSSKCQEIPSDTEYSTFSNTAVGGGGTAHTHTQTETHAYAYTDTIAVLELT